MSKPDAKSPTVDVNTLAKLFNLTTVWVQKLAKDGTIVKGERGRYELWPSIKGYIKHLQERRVNQWDGGNDEEGYGEHRARLTKAKADIAEIDAALRKNEVHDSGAVMAAWVGMISNAKAKLLALPTTLAGRVHGEENLEDIRAIIEEAVYQALNELADYDPSLVTGANIPDDSGPLEAAAEVDNQPMGGQPEAP